MNFNKKGFTLVELLVVMGILGVLMSVTILVINPAEYLRRARDTQRVTDLNTLNNAINLYIANNHNILDLVIPQDCYFSATNGFLTIDGSGYCANGYYTSNTSRATDGTGWLPINLDIDGNSPFSALPIDPQNGVMYYEVVASATSNAFANLFFPKAFAYMGGGGSYTYQYFHSYGFTAAVDGTYKLVTKMESQSYTNQMANDGGTSEEYYETGSGISLPIEPGPSPTTTTTTPPGPKQIFVTTGTWNGNLGGLTGAAAKCQTAAIDAGLSGTYVAWLSGDGYYASDYTSSANYYILVDTTRVADSEEDLTDGTLQTAINKDEYSNARNTAVWTGTDSMGYDSGYTCTDWTNSTSGISGTAGLSSAADQTWTDNGTAACNSLKSLYCVEQ
jgi:prepilin-type N-terminal cleavage/methylation domain-containing protein